MDRQVATRTLYNNLRLPERAWRRVYDGTSSRPGSFHGHDDGSDRACREPWPDKRVDGRGFGVFWFLVVLADDSGGRTLPVRLNGPEGHRLFRGYGDHPHPESAEVITAGLRAEGVTVTSVDIDELDPADHQGTAGASSCGRAREPSSPRRAALSPAAAGPHRVRAGHGRDHRCAGPGGRPADGPAHGLCPGRPGGPVHQGHAAATLASRLSCLVRRGSQVRQPAR
jgi:hypothetical protein